MEGADVVRKIIRSGRVAQLLGVSKATVLRMRKKPGFPVPLDIPGHPRWYEDRVVSYINARDREEIALTAFLENHPECRDLSPEDQLTLAREDYARAAENARERGADPKVIASFQAQVAALTPSAAGV